MCVCVCLLPSVCLCGFVTTLPHLQAHVYRQGQLLDEEGRDRKMIWIRSAPKTWPMGQGSPCGSPCGSPVVMTCQCCQWLSSTWLYWIPMVQPDTSWLQRIRIVRTTREPGDLDRSLSCCCIGASCALPGSDLGVVCADVLCAEARAWPEGSHEGSLRSPFCQCPIRFEA